MYITWLDEDNLEFPPTNTALTDPNGLLAAGGDLSINRLLKAYSQGIFPWFSDDEPFMWWSPSPRCVIYPDQFHASKSLKKLARKGIYQISCNTHFSDVIEACSQERADHSGTWITEEMKDAYLALHHQGYAHSIEVFKDNVLVGGLYGVAIGKVFFGESMFSKAPNTSKLAIYTLANWMNEQDMRLIDCQVTNDHLLSLGAIEIERGTFESILQKNNQESGLNRLKLNSFPASQNNEHRA